MFTINDLTENKSKHSFSFKMIFSVYLKAGKKRILISTLTGIIIFLSLTAFFMTWYNNRYDSFYNYIEHEHDWYNDNQISISGSEEVFGSFTIESNYLNKAINEVTTEFDKIMPGALENVTAGLRLQVYHYVDLFNITNYNLVTLDSNSTESLSHSLTEGRMPQNYTEIIYYRTNSSSKISLNNIIPLQSVFTNASNVINCTIVGIIENAKDVFYRDGRSADILDWKEDYDFYVPESSTSDQYFFTKTEFFEDIVDFYPTFESSFGVKVDFKYQFTIQHIRNIPTYLKELDKYDYDVEFQYIPGYYVPFCNDLVFALQGFNRIWLLQTVGVFASALPVIFLFGLLSIETFKIGSHEQESKFRLMKTHGLELKEIRRILLLENLMKSGTSLIIGFGLGVLVGYFIFLGIGSTYDFNYLLATVEPLIIIVLFVLFAGFFIGGFIVELLLAKKAAVTTPTQYKKKRKFLRKIFSIQEIAILFPAVLFLAIGFTGLFLIDWFIFIESSFILTFKALCWFSASIGVLFALTSIFLLISRLVNLLWNFLGKKSWNLTKDYFTLSLKHLSIYGKNYQRILLVALIFGLGVTPGFIINKSVNNHIPIEANLSVGCADILVDNWNVDNNRFKENISRIDGVDHLTEVSVSTITSSFELYDTQYSQDEYKIRIFTIHNISEFNQVVSFTELTKNGYSKNDIGKLETNLTYLMSRSYAHKNKYDNGVTFKTTMITSSSFEPYEMTFVNAFDYFPLLSRITGTFIKNWMKTYEFDLVTSKTTSELLLNRTDLSKTKKGFLLIKTSENANATKIKEEILNNFGYKSYTSLEKEKSIRDNINTFSLGFLLANSIITLVVVFIFGTISAINIYKQRLRIIESEYQIGASRRQIWGNFTIELVLIILIPFAISMAVALPIINNFSVYVINIMDVYKKFVPWIPWWIIPAIIVLGITIITSSWLLKMIPLVKGYRPIKQE